MVKSEKMADCNVCCEKFNKSTRLNIVCCFCDFNVCRSCFNKYTLDTLRDPHCMNCKKTFTREFINSACTSAFISKELKARKEAVLFDRENGLLIETMPYVELLKQHDENTAARRNLEKERTILQNQITVINNTIYQIQNFNMRITETIKHEQGINAANAVLPGQSYNTENNKQVVKEVKKFTRRCPSEGCLGFLNTDWKCVICEVVTCKHCNEPFGKDHTCDPEKVENVKFINNDSKPCPECGEFIFKIEGCYMMWCTACNTPWDWKTGLKITSNNIHNPHYFEFMRKNAVTLNGNNGCRQFDLNNFMYYLKNTNCNTDTYNYLIKIYQIKQHIHHWEIRAHTPSPSERPIVFNRNLRIKYLLKQIDEKEFKKLIFANEKVCERKQEMIDILNMFVNVIDDLYNSMLRWFGNPKPQNEKTEYVYNQQTIVQNLVEYFNSSMERYGKTYKVVYPGINNGKYYKNIVNGIVAYH
jgi:hypothetical protein